MEPMKQFPNGSRVKDLDGLRGTVSGISKDGGKYRWVKWDDGTARGVPVGELSAAEELGQNAELP